MALDLRVSTSDLTNEAGQLKKLKSDFEKELMGMRSISARYLSMWDGAAKADFRQSVETNIITLQNFLRTFEAYAKALESIAQIYEKGEQDARTRATEKNG